MNFTKKILKKLLPRKFKLPLIYASLQRSNKLDQEMFLASNLCKQKRVAIDVGANNGLYSFFYSKQFKEVKSFEPFRMAASNLISAKIKNINIFHYALSSEPGEQILQAPISSDGTVVHSQASFNKFGGQNVQIPVELRTLDSFEFQNVDMLKIDVEGHEQKVLEGAIDTITRYKPVILIELEERHLGFSPESVILYIESFGYEGFVVVDEKMIKANQFDYLSNQRDCIDSKNFKNYCNNFIFSPVETA